MLAKAVGTKSISQIKNFYYDFKKQSGKYRSSGEKKASKSDSSRTKENDVKLKDAVEHAETPKEAEAQSDSAPMSEPRAGGRHLVDSATSHPHEEEIDERAGGCHSGGADILQVDVTQKNTSLADHGMELLPGGAQNQEVVESAPVHVPSEAAEYGDGNRALLQQLLTQQLQQQQQQQQQHHQQDIAQHRQSLQQQHLHLGQQPQSAIQQMLSQHHQRDSQQAGQVAMEEVHRLLQQQQTQNHHQHALSNLLPWVTASQLLQTQSRLQHPHQDGNQMAEMTEGT
jgi:hypothetical protein